MKILGGASLAVADVHEDAESLRTILYDRSGQPLVQGWPGREPKSAFFSAIGNTSTIAAGMTFDNYRIAMRMLPNGRTRALIQRMEICIVGTTDHASAQVAGSLGWQRFSGGYPTHASSLVRWHHAYGNAGANTLNKMDQSNPRTSRMGEIREMADGTSLAITTVDLGQVLNVHKQSLKNVAGGGNCQWLYLEGPRRTPVVLMPGDGLFLKCTSTMPATATWAYNWTVYWKEEELDQDDVLLAGG